MSKIIWNKYSLSCNSDEPHEYGSHDKTINTEGMVS